MVLAHLEVCLLLVQSFFLPFFQIFIVILKIWKNVFVRHLNFNWLDSQIFCTYLVIPWAGLVHWMNTHIHFFVITTARKYDTNSIVAWFWIFSIILFIYLSFFLPQAGHRSILTLKGSFITVLRYIWPLAEAWFFGFICKLVYCNQVTGKFQMILLHVVSAKSLLVRPIWPIL